MSASQDRRSTRVMPAIAAVLAIFLAWSGANSQEPGEEEPDADGPTIEAYYIFLAPTMARLHGDGYQPGVTLWLDVTDPLGTVFTTQVVADGEGRLVADVAVDEPGVHQTQIRDSAGQVLSEGNLLVGLQ